MTTLFSQEWRIEWLARDRFESRVAIGRNKGCGVRRPTNHGSRQVVEHDKGWLAGCSSEQCCGANCSLVDSHGGQGGPLARKLSRVFSFRSSWPLCRGIHAMKLWCSCRARRNVLCWEWVTRIPRPRKGRSELMTCAVCELTDTIASRDSTFLGI
jgi:hypothetical protein